MNDALKYLPFVLIGLITLVQLFVRLSARRMRGHSLSELEGLLEPGWMDKEKLVLYFSSAYCAPCKTMAPLVEQLIAEGGNLVKLDAIEHGELASRLGARGAPAFVEVRRGQVMRVHLGALTEAKLRQMV